MTASIAAAFEKANMKKSPKAKGGKGGLIHPAFPPQAAAQAAHMGSQSASPVGGGSSGIPMPGDPSGMSAGGPSMDPSGMGGY